MKLTKYLTKEYYFPIVEGSNFASVKDRIYVKGVGTGLPLNGFVTYLLGRDNQLIKAVNYSQRWNWLRQKAIEWRKGYNMKTWEGTHIAVAELAKANEYLNKQYKRIASKLQKGEVFKAVAIWRILHTRSKLWMMVLLIRKIDFLEIPVKKMRKMIKTISRKMKRESSALRFTRIFLTEYNTDGSVKKHRPLGVPDQEWRVIAASYEFLLTNVWKATWGTNQYACMPNSGTVDAWMRILRKLAQGNVNEIIGYDLAKFFDLVYITNLRWMLSGMPEFLLDYFRRLVVRKPKVFKEDRELEEERVKAADQERGFIRTIPSWDIVPEHMKEVAECWNHTITAEQSREAPYVSFPQGLNTSPIMCCRALQLTGAIDHPNIVQYVDDGVILNTKDEGNLRGSTYTLDEFRDRLLTAYTGIALSEKKTERIMEGGKYLKPLKFLGMQYDGKKLIGNSRKSGIYEAKNAEARTREILRSLKRFPEGLNERACPKDLKQYNRIRKSLAILMAESCDPNFELNKENQKKEKLPASKEDLDIIRAGGIIHWKKTNKRFWKETQMRIYKIRNDSVEAQMAFRLPTHQSYGPETVPKKSRILLLDTATHQIEEIPIVVESLNKLTFGKVMESTNTATMMGAYFLMNCLNMKIVQKPISIEEESKTGKVAKIEDLYKLHLSKHGGKKLPFPEANPILKIEKEERLADTRLLDRIRKERLMSLTDEQRTEEQRKEIERFHKRQKARYVQDRRKIPRQVVEWWKQHMNLKKIGERIKLEPQSRYKRLEKHKERERAFIEKWMRIHAISNIWRWRIWTMYNLLDEYRIPVWRLARLLYENAGLVLIFTICGSHLLF